MNPRKKWKLANPEKVREAKRRWGKRHYQRNWLSIGMFQQLMRLAFPQKSRESKRREYIKHIDRYRSSNREWRLKNADSIREQKRIYHLNNRSSCLERAKKWHILHPGRVRIHKAKNKSKRRAIEKQCSIEDSKAISGVYARAEHLRRWFNVVVDHIIPLAKGGSHSPDNLQIIYRSENSRKSASLNYQPEVIFI